MHASSCVLIGVLEEFCFCFVLFYKSFDSFGVYS